MKFGDYITEANDRVAKTILAQIKALDRWALQAWGAKTFVSFKDGVQFDVRGSKFRGRVVIKLDKSRDLYNIEFGTIQNFEWKVRKQLKGIGVENLVMVLDDFIG